MGWLKKRKAPPETYYVPLTRNALMDARLIRIIVGDMEAAGLRPRGIYAELRAASPEQKAALQTAIPACREAAAKGRGA